MSDLTYEQIMDSEITLAFRRGDDFFLCVKGGGNSIYRVNPEERTVEWMYFTVWLGEMDTCEEIDLSEERLRLNRPTSMR